MRVLPLAALALTACFHRSSDSFTCSVTSDCDDGRICEGGFCVIGSIDAPVDTVDAPFFDCALWTPAPRHFDPCMIAQPAGSLVADLPGVYTYNTTNNQLTDPNLAVLASPAMTDVTSGRVISLVKLEVKAGSTLRVIGDQPLIVASWTDIEVAGVIEAGSDITNAGPGANPTDCGTRTGGRGNDNANGASGGGGGGFRGPGGQGGVGDGQVNPGTAGQTIPIPLLAGGCAGGTGGTGDVLGGPGGSGGGAIQLTAQGMLTIAGTGVVNAGGGGGTEGTSEANTGDGGGGGGGGSGGMIGFEANTIIISTGAILAANGGGGGQGGDNAAGGRGSDGTATATRATGGSGGGGGPGGLGSGGATLNGQNGQPDVDGGGGGGGGGAGFIAIKSTVAPTIGTATISPAQTIVP